MPSTRPLGLLLLLLLPATASADIYKWTDQNGGTVYSNAPPAKGKAKNVAVVIDEGRVPTPTQAQIAQAEALRVQQALLERMYALERQVQALQYQGQYQVAMPPPPASYYGNYGGSYYPGYYPAVYRYPVFIAPTGFVRRAPAHRGGGHRGMR